MNFHPTGNIAVVHALDRGALVHSKLSNSPVRVSALQESALWTGH